MMDKDEIDKEIELIVEAESEDAIEQMLCDSELFDKANRRERPSRTEWWRPDTEGEWRFGKWRKHEDSNR